MTFGAVVPLPSVLLLSLPVLLTSPFASPGSRVIGRLTRNVAVLRSISSKSNIHQLPRAQAALTLWHAPHRIKVYIDRAASESVEPCWTQKHLTCRARLVVLLTRRWLWSWLKASLNPEHVVRQFSDTRFPCPKLR